MSPNSSCRNLELNVIAGSTHADKCFAFSAVWEGNLKIRRTRLLACLVLLPLTVLTQEAAADTGSVSVVFTKGGFIVDVGGGQGVLTFRGKKYPFTVSGMSLGFSIGASTSKFVGRAFNLRTARDLAGTYAVIGGGGAIAAGGGAVQLQNANGVVLQLSGARVGAEVSAAVGGVTITMQ